MSEEAEPYITEGSDTENVNDFEREPVEERETTTSDNEQRAANDKTQEVLAAVDPWKEALTKSSAGGEPKDWQLGHEGRGYSFDGEHVRDQAGTIWKEGAELDPEMFQQWREGGDAFYRLPDYPEHTEDRDRIWETLMHFDKETNEVSYRIYYHDVMHPKKEEFIEEFEDRAEAAVARVEMFADAFEFEPTANDNVAEVFARAKAAEELSISDSEPQKFSFDEPVANVIEITAPQQQVVSDMPQVPAAANDSEVQAAWLAELLKDPFEVSADVQTASVPEVRADAVAQPIVSNVQKPAEPRIEYAHVPAPAKNEIDRPSFVKAAPVPALSTIEKVAPQRREDAPAMRAEQPERVEERELDELVAELLKDPLAVASVDLRASTTAGSDAHKEPTADTRRELTAQPVVSNVHVPMELRIETPKVPAVVEKNKDQAPVGVEHVPQDVSVPVEIAANDKESVIALVVPPNVEVRRFPAAVRTPNIQTIMPDIRASTEPVAAVSENVRSAREYEPSMEVLAKQAEAEKEARPSSQSAETVLRALGLQISGTHAMPTQTDEPTLPQDGRNVFPFAPRGARASTRTSERENKQFRKDGVIMTRVA